MIVSQFIQPIFGSENVHLKTEFSSKLAFVLRIIKLLFAIRKN